MKYVEFDWASQAHEVLDEAGPGTGSVESPLSGEAESHRAPRQPTNRKERQSRVNRKRGVGRPGAARAKVSDLCVSSGYP
jgi:hypothetical protein